MSKLSVGIVGLPNVGKSTLFKALTKAEVNVANYPFATIDPNVGVVSVPDERLDKLASLSSSVLKIPAVVEFYDIAGLVKGANEGEGLGNQFLAHIKEVRVIVHVVRVFAAGEIIHVEGSIDPPRDFEIINTELMLKDLEIMERRVDKAEKEARTGDKKKQQELSFLEKVKKTLEGGELAISLGDEVVEAEVIRELGLLTAKPQIVLFNGLEGEVSEDLKAKIGQFGFEYVVMDLSTSVSLAELIRQAYKTLDLITFFTTGEKETRGWTVKRGALAPQAAGVIHTDFEQKFIRAEAIHTEKLLEAGGWAQARDKGWIRTEGKSYEIQDGDVLVIRHS
ncbi:MAG: redox-regulated ATPase YchF [bacterium]|nr:redox-regulated ATPase YchF [bacterium]MDZ4231385.1 redox-regulated ATPase YchF [Patescibacteria group bacterium]